MVFVFGVGMLWLGDVENGYRWVLLFCFIENILIMAGEEEYIVWKDRLFYDVLLVERVLDVVRVINLKC